MLGGADAFLGTGAVWVVLGRNLGLIVSRVRLRIHFDVLNGRRRVRQLLVSRRHRCHARPYPAIRDAVSRWALGNRLSRWR